MNKKLTENEVLETMDFLKDVFGPSNPELEAAIQRRVDPVYFDNGEDKIVLPSRVDEMFDDEEVKHVLHVVNARKPILRMFDAPQGFGSEPVNGYTINLVRGQLGMIRPGEVMVA